MLDIPRGNAVPMMTVQHPHEAITPDQKDTLAEDLTQVILQIEGGADTPAGRSIAWVRFQPIAREYWYLGGRNDATFEAAAGRWLIELNVPEGSMNQDRKTDCHKGTSNNAVSVWR
jgi:phenylpyruvate tautomerase PptA (4-oxalocrotonate tautomerase family)